jgi:hypothetical protein
MREIRNVTVAVSEGTYNLARVWVVRHHTSISESVEFLLDYLPELMQAIQNLKKQYPDFETRGRTRP